jgi:hypothetical protein
MMCQIFQPDNFRIECFWRTAAAAVKSRPLEDCAKRDGVREECTALFSSGSASGEVDGGVSGRLSIFDTKLMISSLPLTSYMSPVAELTRYTAALFPMKLPSMSSESVQSVTQVLSRYMMLALTSKLNTFRRVAANTNVSIVGK